MKLEELRTGDMIIMRNADMGMVQVRDPEIYLLYFDTGFHNQHGNTIMHTYPPLKTMNLREIAAEDLKGIQDDGEHDIMQVFRREKGMIDFDTFEEGEMVYDRDRSWIRPPVDLLDKAIFRRFTKQIKELEEGREKGGIIFADHTWKYDISAVVSDDPEKVMYYRYLDSQLIVNRIRDYLEYIPIPGTRDLYIVCSNFWLRERNRGGWGTGKKAYAVIPEKDMEINLPVFACRRSASGEFGSLTAEDAPILFKYMTCRDRY
jgi:hypothetical protein